MYKIDEIMNKRKRCLGRYTVCGVYKITNVKNDKIYIGSSKNILKRWKAHISELENNKHKNYYLQDDWNEYGKDSFVFEILEQCPESKRYDIEQKYLTDLKPFYRTGNGYNICEKSTERNEPTVRFYKPKDGSCNYFYVKAKGCKPHIMDADHCNNTLKEDLEWECFCLDEYSRIKNEMIYYNGPDDWEW